MVFYEITKNAIREAIGEPRDLSEDLVNAQQARRALDYLVGFNLSPLLWKKVRRGLSAGRVQSPALRLIVEREEEIAAFKSQEYWTIDADVAHASARHSRRGSSSIAARRSSSSRSRTKTAAREVEQRSGDTRTASCSRSPRSTASSAAAIPRRPFTTSTLQQEAARKLGFSAQKTMRIAQQLYEGVDIGEGAVGLITYMRTDSVTLAQEAVSEMREVIAKRYGEEGLAGGAARLQDQGEERAGSARGHSPDLGRDHADRSRRQDRGRSVQALRAHLEAHRRVPDEPRASSTPSRVDLVAGADGPAPQHVARERLDAREARLHGRLPGRPRRRERRRHRPRAARRCRSATASSS